MIIWYRGTKRSIFEFLSIQQFCLKMPRYLSRYQGKASYRINLFRFPSLGKKHYSPYTAGTTVLQFYNLFLGCPVLSTKPKFACPRWKCPQNRTISVVEVDETTARQSTEPHPSQPSHTFEQVHNFFNIRLGTAKAGLIT